MLDEHEGRGRNNDWSSVMTGRFELQLQNDRMFILESVL